MTPPRFSEYHHQSLAHSCGLSADGSCDACVSQAIFDAKIFASNAVQAQVDAALSILFKDDGSGSSIVMRYERIEGIMSEGQLNDLLEQVQRWCLSKNIDPKVIQVDWHSPIVRLYQLTSLATFMPGVLAFPLSRLPHRGSPFYMGGSSSKITLFQDTGCRQPCLSLYSVQSLFPNQPVVVFDMMASWSEGAQAQREELTQRGLDWIGGSEGIKVAVTLDLAIDHCIALKAMRVQKWSAFKADSDSVGKPYTYKEIAEEGYYQYWLPSGSIHIEGQDFLDVVNNGTLDVEAEKAEISLTPLDLGLSLEQAEKLNYEWEEPVLKFSVKTMHTAITKQLENYSLKRRHNSDLKQGEASGISIPT